MEKNKTKGQKLSEKIGYKTKNAWEKSGSDESKKAFKFCESYKDFLNIVKTEREFVNEVKNICAQKGFVCINDLKKAKKPIAPGTKIMSINKNKSLVLGIIGKKPIEEGASILGAHIDSPRIDLKQNPLYEDTDMALLKTHYYGGIKKYQWVAIPLSIRGVIVKEDGTTINVSLGEEDGMAFTITDLLPHLARDQMQKKMSEAIEGEGLNLLFGSIPYKDEKVKEKVKLNILNLLSEKYSIKEEDFISSELEIVPSFKALDIGLDRGMVGAYGQDDRVCAYGSLKAFLDTKIPARTSVLILSDKEEIGSMGNTGAQSAYFENFMAQICNLSSVDYNDIIVRNCLENSSMLSADVTAGVDPNYEGVQDKRNASFLGKGVVIEKYTGARGKAGASDANAEYISKVRKIFNDNNIIWQTGEIGKVDLGGGGTIAQYMANLGIEVLDCGVPILSMHAPFEVSSKIDVYMLYKAYKSFLKDMS